MKNIMTVFAALALCSTALSANTVSESTAMTNTKPPCRFVYPAELKTVKGGISSGGGGGGKGGTANSKQVNIVLSNVPYVNQYVSGNSRSNAYCGLANALMVRAKDAAGAPTPTVSNPASSMRSMDVNLLNGYTSGTDHSIDVVRNQGLFYANFYDNAATQYNKTIRVINDIYTKYNDGIIHRRHVTSVDAAVASAAQTPDTIWNHIKNYNQPVVVVIDSNISAHMQNNDTPPSTRGTPTLHYVVIRGIREQTQGGTKYFSVYDPARAEEQPVLHIQQLN